MAINENTPPNGNQPPNEVREDNEAAVLEELEEDTLSFHHQQSISYVKDAAKELVDQDDGNIDTYPKALSIAVCNYFPEPGENYIITDSMEAMAKIRSGNISFSYLFSAALQFDKDIFEETHALVESIMNGPHQLSRGQAMIMAVMHIMTNPAITNNMQLQWVANSIGRNLEEDAIRGGFMVLKTIYRRGAHPESDGTDYGIPPMFSDTAGAA